ncbi:hypothetical protein ABH947_003721 [Bacillus sp. RC206]
MYYPLFSQYTLTTIFHLEIYDCTNTVWVEKIGGVQVQLLSTDRIPPFIFQLLILSYYVTYLHYIIYFSNIKVFFLKIQKAEHFHSAFYLLIFFWKNNSFIQLNCNEVINRINNYENYDWYPNTEVRIH